MSQKKLTIALAGNPNCGKTTIFNALTGANQHVGNYSGVTVEKKDGIFKYNGEEIDVIDLPGTYSLNYHSPEERVAQDELLSGKVDLLVAIVDSGSLSRSLLFVAQLMQLNLPMILCLNMWDEAQKAGLQLKIDEMAGLLGMPVIPTVASHGKGIDELKENIVNREKHTIPTDHLRLGSHATNAINSIKAVLPDSHKLYPDWVATKLLMDDAKFTEEVGKLDGGNKIIELAKSERAHIESDTKMDISQYITEQYYGFVDGLLKEVTVKNLRADARATSDNIDKVLAHPFFGLIIFFIIMWALFQLTFTLGQFPMDWIEAGFDKLGELCSGIENETVKSLIVDGIIGGVGGVLVFLPNIIILFLGLSFLEDTGYMARTAFLLDKWMHAIGLHGRSFIPMMTGFGCSVPGIMATRTIAGEKERLTTMFVLPFISCGARLPIWLLLVPIFFPLAYQGTAMFCIYLLGVLVALAVAFILRKTIYKGDDEPFVMELPPYRLPTLRAILMHMWERSWLYLKKAGTIILALSIILWAGAYFHAPWNDDLDEDALSAEVIDQIKTEEGGAEIIAAHENYIKLNPDVNFEKDSPFVQKVAELAEAKGLDPEDEDAAEDIEKITEELKTSDPKLFEDGEAFDAAKVLFVKTNNYIEDKKLETSWMGSIGKGFGYIFKPLGFDWKISTAVLGSLAAKEVFVSQMGIVYSLGGEVDAEAELDESGVSEDEGANSLRQILRSQYSVLHGICLIIFMLLTSPCIATLAVAKRESNSWKFAAAQFFGMFAIAYILAEIVYAVGSLFT